VVISDILAESVIPSPVPPESDLNFTVKLQVPANLERPVDNACFSMSYRVELDVPRVRENAIDCRVFINTRLGIDNRMSKPLPENWNPKKVSSISVRQLPPLINST
jgi:hypothetical protein